MFGLTTYWMMFRFAAPLYLINGTLLWRQWN
jgi:hypothetical protein